MEPDTIPRRRLLHNAGVAAGGAVAAGLAMSSPVHAGKDDDDDDHDDDNPRGSWVIKRIDEGDPTVYTAVLSLARGGVVISKDISPAGPPGTGAWRAKGRRFYATFWFGFPGDDGPGSPGPTARVRAKGKVKDDNVAGTYTFEFFAPDGTPVPEFSGTGSFEGTRLEP